MTERTGHVVQINISQGGVPKLPVPRARVGFTGLEGDGHSDKRNHGGPDRAVSLLAIEVIDQLRAEGHPIAPGSTGENLTVSGLAYTDLQRGDRLQIGNEVLLELTTNATPCTTIADSFQDGDYSRLSHKRHPGSARWYARVLRAGFIETGAEIRLLQSEGIPQGGAASV